MFIPLIFKQKVTVKNKVHVHRWVALLICCVWPALKPPDERSDHYDDATDTATLLKANLREKREVTSIFGV